VGTKAIFGFSTTAPTLLSIAVSGAILPSLSLGPYFSCISHMDVVNADIAGAIYLSMQSWVPAIPAGTTEIDSFFVLADDSC
jgi:hypothetical protein